MVGVGSGKRAVKLEISRARPSRELGGAPGVFIGTCGRGIRFLGVFLVREKAEREPYGEQTYGPVRFEDASGVVHP
jgi:hypothetical protein